jgi:hypothetical protein
MALSDNLLAYYKFDNNGSDGVSLIDSTPNGRTLSAPAGISGLSLGEGIIAGDASFDGDGITYLSRNGQFLSPFGAKQSQYSVSAWIRTSNDAFIVNSATGENYAGSTIELNIVGGQIAPTVWWGGNSQYSFDRLESGPNLTDGDWHHCVFTWNAYGDLISYVDGDETGRIQSSGNLANIALANLSFNSNADGTFAVGRPCQIDEVGIWNRALSSAEVTNLYNYGNGISYPFDEFYFNAIINNSLATLGNWWRDDDCIVPATILPDSSSSVLIRNVATSGTFTYAEATIYADIGSAVSITASRITLNSGINSGTLIGSVVLNNSSSNAGIITGNAEIYYPSSNPIGGVVTGSKTYIWENGDGAWGNEIWINGSAYAILPIASNVLTGISYGVIDSPRVGTLNGDPVKLPFSLASLLKLPMEVI